MQPLPPYSLGVPHDIYNSYTALSYVWGYHADKSAIFIDNKPIDVTRNLAAALHALRHNTETYQVWADAACIDQFNTLE